MLTGGRVSATYCKRELPNYQVFDERRYFASGRDAGQGPVVFDVDGLKFGINICEDAWFDEPPRAAKAAGADVLCVINASPFHLGKLSEREDRMQACVHDVGLPLLFVHLTGGQDVPRLFWWRSTAGRPCEPCRSHLPTPDRRLR